jgi:WD40 repeat protein
MKKIKIVGLLIIAAAFFASCMTTKPPKPFRDVPPSANNAFITLAEEMAVTHVDGRRVSWNSATRRYEIAAGNRELTLRYRTSTYDISGRQIWETASGIKFNGMFEAGKSYIILNHVEGIASRYRTTGRRVAVFVIENTEQSKIQITLPNYKPSTTAMVGAFFSPDGSRLLVVHDKALYIYNANDGTLEMTIRERSGIIGAGGIWSPDGAKIIAVTPRAIRIWDSSTGNVISSINITRARFANMLHITPDGSKLVGQSGNILKVWDINSGAELVSINGLYRMLGIAFITLSPDGQFFAATFNDATRVYSISGGEPIFSIGQRRETYIPIEFIDSNTLIASQWVGGIFGQPKEISIDISSRQVTELEDEYIPRIRYSHDGSRILNTRLAGGRRYIQEIDAITNETVRQFTSPNADITVLMPSPVENKFATFSFIDGKIRIWEF